MNTQRIAIFMAMAAVAATAYSQEADTVVIDSPKQVIITQTADSIDIRVAGKEGNPDYRFEQRARLATGGETITTTAESRHSPLGWDFGSIEKNKNAAVVSLAVAPRIDMGVMVPLSTPDGMKGPFFKSAEMALKLLTIKLEAPRGKWWLGLDVAFNMKFYTLEGERQLTSGNDGILSLSPYPAGSTDGVSRLMTTMNGGLELNYNYRFWKRSALGLGVELIFGGSRWDHCRNNYTDADGNAVQQLYDAKTKPCNLNFKLTWYDHSPISFYVRYSPWSPFKGNDLSRLSTLSFGVGFGF